MKNNKLDDGRKMALRTGRHACEDLINAKRFLHQDTNEMTVRIILIQCYFYFLFKLNLNANSNAQAWAEKLASGEEKGYDPDS